MPGPTDMNDLLDDAPASLLTDDQNEQNEEEQDDKDLEEELEDETTDTDGDSDAGDSGEDSDDDQEERQDSKDSDEEVEDDNEDYVTQTDIDEEDEDDKSTTAPSTNPSTDPSEVEAKWVLDQLQPISVRIVNASDKVETIKVYGYGDLPQDFKGFASKYEEGLFTQAVTAQRSKAVELQTQYRQDQARKSTEEWQQKENKSIASDLKSLREEGIFPKFKGKPGTREFDSSQGAQIFDEVVTYMNGQNEAYAEGARKGEAYYHISFKQAFNELYPGLKEAMASENKARRGVARKLKSTQGTEATKSKATKSSVLNITELEDEFSQFVGANNA
jgi:hypothetical protein